MATAIFALYALKDTVLQSGLDKWDLTGATATVEVGASNRGVTATRVVALGLLSLAAKKDKTKVYITIDLANGEQVIIDAPAKKEPRARQFAAAVNRAAKTAIT